MNRPTSKPSLRLPAIIAAVLLGWAANAPAMQGPETIRDQGVGPLIAAQGNAALREIDRDLHQQLRRGLPLPQAPAITAVRQHGNPAACRRGHVAGLAC